jgi:ribosomal protein S27AE
MRVGQCERPQVETDTKPRMSGQCPKCGGVLTTNQDGWKVCYACGYSAPGYTPPPSAAAVGNVVSHG